MFEIAVYFESRKFFPTMNRRTFLTESLAGVFAGMAGSQLVTSSWGSEEPASVDINLHSLLQANDPEAMRLVEDIFRECVLGKVCPPTGTLKHN
jgi:hypothetical protein